MNLSLKLLQKLGLSEKNKQNPDLLTSTFLNQEKESPDLLQFLSVQNSSCLEVLVFFHLYLIRKIVLSDRNLAKINLSPSGHISMISSVVKHKDDAQALPDAVCVCLVTSQFQFKA